jgi:pimeloyl-ACP methyl ester carboxylesterase
MRLLLLPGLDGTGVLFRPLLECLPQGIEPTVISLPNDRALGYPELLEHVSPQIPSNGPFVLLGESFSGPLSILIASQQPRGLAGLILCASFVSNPTALPSSASLLTRAWLFRFTPAFIQAKALLGGYASPSLRSLLSQAHTQVSPHVMAQRVRSVLTVNLSAALSSCTVPLAYLRGQFDHVVPKRNLRRILKSNPHTQVFTVAAPHLVLQVQPQASARAISTFVDSVRAA